MALIQAALVAGLAGCALAPPFYWAESIHGRVVDADTGQPIQGAAVVADWKLYGGGMGHGGHRSSMLVEETVTDSNGEFRFGKWGPKLRPYYGILDTAPWLVIFKSGYEQRFLPNDQDSNWIVRRSDWNGHQIELTVFRGTPQERLNHLDLALTNSDGRPVTLREILKEKPAYYRYGPAFFDNVERLLTIRTTKR
jgi:hypothetical protein